VAHPVEETFDRFAEDLNGVARRAAAVRREMSQSANSTDANAAASLGKSGE